MVTHLLKSCWQISNWLSFKNTQASHQNWTGIDQAAHCSPRTQLNTNPRGRWTQYWDALFAFRSQKLVALVVVEQLPRRPLDCQPLLMPFHQVFVRQPRRQWEPAPSHPVTHDHYMTPTNHLQQGMIFICSRTKISLYELAATWTCTYTRVCVPVLYLCLGNEKTEL